MGVIERCTESEDGLHCTHWWHDGGPCHFCGADGRDGIVRERDALRDQLAGAVGERDEALRLLANATDPENADDWDEAREVGWAYARKFEHLWDQ